MALFGGRKREKATGCPEWLRKLLLEGVTPEDGSPDCEAYFEMTFVDPEGVRRAWAVHADELTGRWVADHPGARPGLWWRYSAPEGRRQTAGEPIERGALHDQVDDEGLPIALAYFAHPRVKFESQAAFLRRHKLLLEGEAVRVPRSAFRPEAIEAEPEEAEDAGHHLD